MSHNSLIRIYNKLKRSKTTIMDDDMSDDNFDESDLNRELQRMWQSLKLKLDCIYNEDPCVNLNFLIHCHDEVYNYAMHISEQNIRLRHEGQQEFFPGESHKALRFLYLKAIEYIRDKSDIFAKNYDPTLSSEQVFSSYSNDWRRFKVVHKRLQSVFRYLDRFFVPTERDDINVKKGKIVEIFQFSLKTWHHKIFVFVQDIIADEIINNIKAERSGKTIDQAMVSYASKSFIEIGSIFDDDPMQLYRQLESRFIESTRRVYEDKSRRYMNEINLLKTMTFTDYINVTNEILEKEKSIVGSFMDESSLAATISICEECLIKDHDELFNKFLNQFLLNDERQMISPLFELISRFPDNFGIFKATFKDHIVKEANDKVARLSNVTNPDAREYVDILKDTLTKYESIVTEEFRNNPQFHETLVSAAESFINGNIVAEAENVNNNARLFSKYCDILLSTEPLSESSEQNHEELKKSLESVLTIVKLATDKVGFLKFYETITTPRIIFCKSKSDELEDYMISQLQQLAEKTNKDFGISGTDALTVKGLKGISENLKTSKDINDSFRAQNKSEDDSTVLPNFSVMVIDERNWPYVKSSPYAVSGQYLTALPVFESTIERFNKFYMWKFSGGKYPRKGNDCSRKLTWLHNLGKGELNAQLSGKRYILLTGAFQTAVMMAFNEKDSYTFQELKEVSGTLHVPKYFLLNTMKKLFESKILICSGDQTNLDPNSMISLNMDFQSKKTRIGLETALTFDNANQTDQADVDDHIRDDRDTLANLAMVRIFKRIRRLNQNDILYLLTLELRPLFKPEKEIMKRAINYCVKNSYMKPDDNDASFYVYIE